MFGYQIKRVWGRTAQQAENRAAIPKKQADDRWRLRNLAADGFFIAPDGSLKP